MTGKTIYIRISAVFVKSMGELSSGCGTSVGICARIVETKKTVILMKIKKIRFIGS